MKDYLSSNVAANKAMHLARLAVAPRMSLASVTVSGGQTLTPLARQAANVER